MKNILMCDFEYILGSKVDFKKLKNKSILITGATGLIGSLLVRFLLYANKEESLNTHIYALVRNMQKAEAIYSNYSKDNLSFVVSDLAVDSVIIKGPIDYIIHAAAVTKSKSLITQPVDAIKVAINGTEKILDLAKQKCAKSVVYISSMEVYGQPNAKCRVTEKDLGYIDIGKVRSCYPESKRMNECLCNSYSKQFGLNVKVARLAQTFGAGILPSENRVFAQFANSIINHSNIVLHTEGKSEGNYVYTADAIIAIFLMLLSNLHKGTFNVVNEESHTTIYNMAQELIDNFGNGQQRLVIDIPDESMGYAPDVHMKLSGEKFENTFKWKPYVGLMDSYSRLIDYMKLSANGNIY